jgi:transposase
MEEKTAIITGKCSRNKDARKAREFGIYRAVKEGLEAGSFKTDVYRQVAKNFGVSAQTAYNVYFRISTRMEDCSAES